MFIAFLFLLSYIFLYSFTIDSMISPDFIFVFMNYACIDSDVLECFYWIGPTSLDFEIWGSSYSSTILCVFAVTLYLSYMLITTVSVSHVEKEKLLIASVFVFSNKILIKSRIR
jgi:hypothetical protein